MRVVVKNPTLINGKQYLKKFFFRFRGNINCVCEMISVRLTGHVETIFQASWQFSWMLLISSVSNCVYIYIYRFWYFCLQHTLACLSTIVWKQLLT